MSYTQPERCMILCPTRSMGCYVEKCFTEACWGGGCQFCKEPCPEYATWKQDNNLEKASNDHAA